MDDLIVPKAKQNESTKDASFYAVRNVYFLDGNSNKTFPRVPKHMHMMQHVRRSINFSEPKRFVKGFHVPERILTLHNHFPRECLDAPCASVLVDKNDARLQHYREDCAMAANISCEHYKESVTDTVIWKYKDKLVPATNKVLRKLGLLPPCNCDSCY
jgi:hypothetical protein